MSVAREDIKRMKYHPEHGKMFLDLAAKVNAAMGSGFVTVTSDQTYVETENTREFYLLVEPLPYRGETRYGWAWGARMTKRTKAKVERSIRSGGKLVRTRDGRWLNGAKLSQGGYSLAKPGSPEEDEIKHILGIKPEKHASARRTVVLPKGFRKAVEKHASGVFVILGGKKYKLVKKGHSGAWEVEGVPGRRGGGPHVGERYMLRAKPSNTMLSASPGESRTPRRVYLSPTTSRGTADRGSDEKVYFPFDEMVLLLPR